MECYERNQSSTFKPFGVVSNELLRVGVARNDWGGPDARHSSPSVAAGVGGRERKKQQQQRCGRIVLLATPQELGDRCIKFIKEQQSRLHIIRRCAVMLACWPKYRVSNTGS